VTPREKKMLFFAAEIVTRTHLHITLYVKCLWFYKIQVDVSKLYRHERNKNGKTYHEPKIVKCRCNNFATQ